MHISFQFQCCQWDLNKRLWLHFLQIQSTSYQRPWLNFQLQLKAIVRGCLEPILSFSRLSAAHHEMLLILGFLGIENQLYSFLSALFHQMVFQELQETNRVVVLSKRALQLTEVAHSFVQGTLEADIHTVIYNLTWKSPYLLLEEYFWEGNQVYFSSGTQKITKKWRNVPFPLKTTWKWAPVIHYLSHRQLSIPILLQKCPFLFFIEHKFQTIFCVR